MVIWILNQFFCLDGASLIYTSNTVPNSVPQLLRASLGIHSSLSQEPLKHNVVDRDKILIPPNWDSWGKIRVLREGFDIEGTSSSWSEEIGETHSNTANPSGGRSLLFSGFSDVIKDPTGEKQAENLKQAGDKIEIETPAMQEFLTRQLEVMEQLKAEDEAQRTKDTKEPGAGSDGMASATDDSGTHMNEQIGPVQFNMGGIQVDAEDVLRRIKQNARDRTPERKSITAPGPAVATSTPTSRIDPSETQQLSNFFSSLIKRGTPSHQGTPQSKEP